MGILYGCDYVINVNYYIENNTGHDIQVRYYSNKIYDSVDYLLKFNEVWHIDGRRVPLPNKKKGGSSFERDKRFTFGRMWWDNFKLNKNINKEEYWKAVSLSEKDFKYILTLDTTYFSN